MNTTYKQHTQLVVDALHANRYVHLFCRLDNSLPDIASVVADLFEHYENAPDPVHPEWRGCIIAPTWGYGKEFMAHVKKKVRDKSGNRSAAIYGDYGSIHVYQADPERIEGIVGWNLFYILLRNQHPDVWDAVWASSVADTKILAVNSELFDERKEFIYLDWAE